MTGSHRSVAKIPAYTLHKPSGKARVRINGKDHYLGKFGTEESRRRYGELIAKHAAGLPVDPFKSAADGTARSALTIHELVLAFMRHAKVHYRKNGVETSEVHCFVMATNPLIELYGFSTVDEFGPLALKAVREKMVAQKWVRYTINKSISRIRAIFRWAVENEMANPATLQKLQAVAPLLAGRTEAKDNPPRRPATVAQIDAVKPLVAPMVQDLIELQKLTGARSGELLSLTTGGIDRSGPVWMASIGGHKTEHHGHTRTLAIGPQAQLILKKYLAANPNTPLFKMTRTAYCRAITRACEAAGIDRWVPHQLRHCAAATVRREFGLEHAQAVLGHSSFDMTEHYAKVGLSKAVEVAIKIG